MTSNIPFEDPQAAGYAAISFSGSSTPQNLLSLFQQIVNSAHGAPGVWVGLTSDGGSPGAGAVFADLVRALPFPVIGHIHDVFSEGAALAVAFPHRSVGPVGKIGFHQASMTINAGQYQEAKLADLLNQVRGHNRGTALHIHKRLGLPLELATSWVTDGCVFLADEALDLGIVDVVVDVKLSQPASRVWLPMG